MNISPKYLGNIVGYPFALVVQTNYLSGIVIFRAGYFQEGNAKATEFYMSPSDVCIWKVKSKL